MIACTFEVGVVDPASTANNHSEKESQEIDLPAVAGTVEREGEHPSPSETDAACQESPIVGLVFSSREQNGVAVWQVGSCGGHFQLSTQANLRISPDGDRALYTQDDDIWLVDLPNGEPHNLTNTTDRIEVDPQWWPGSDDLVVFGSRVLGEDTGPTAGHLSTVTTDGRDYRVLVDQPSNSPPAPQPGNSIIAYDLGDSAWFYHLDKDESEFFDVSLYELNIHKGMKIGSPSWSPDGKKLAWWVGGTFSPPINGTISLAIFNLETGLVQLLHPYTPIGTGGGLPKPIWSPDGERLAVLTLGEAHKVDLWIIDVDNGEEHLLGFASNPVWHPNGDALVYQAWSDNAIKLIDVDDWQLQILDLPPGSTPVSWLGINLDSSNEGQLPTPNTAPHFGPAIYFATSPKMADSRAIFPYGTPEIFAIWPYSNMLEGLTIRREWYLNGELWLVREEPWNYAGYGAEGILTDISIYDFDQGLEPGRYQLRLYIDGQEQQLGLGEQFSSAIFEISTAIEIPPQVSPDYSQMAIVEPPGTLILQDVETQEKRTLLTVEEISSLAWYPNGKYILYSMRDRSDEQINSSSPRPGDELWVVNLETGENYPFQDQFGQPTGKGLHHPYVSPDGFYVAVIEGSGWADACFVDSNLWVKEIGFSGDRLQETFSHYPKYEIVPSVGDGEMYVKGIIGWDSATLLIIELGWNCTTKNLDGIYLLDMATLTAERIGGPQ
jgi:Tol biopolymer transport system component